MIETTELAPGLNICRIVNGMWQVAGGHGYVTPQKAISEMSQYYDRSEEHTSELQSH